MLVIIIGVAAFIYLWLKINDLQAKVQKLESQKNTSHRKGFSNIPEVPQPNESQDTSRSGKSLAELIVEKQKNIDHMEEVHTQKSHVTTTKTKRTDDSEFAIGSKVLTIVGIGALLLGVIFFLRYAFENELISPGMRVIFGIVAGSGLVALGLYLKSTYDHYAKILMGGGFGIVYMSLYAAYAFYSLIPLTAAMVLLTLLIVGTVALFVSYDSEALTAIAFFAAFLTPILLRTSTDLHMIFPYLLILSAGVIVVALHKHWSWFIYGSMVGSYFVSIGWITLHYTKDDFIAVMTYLTLLFILFFLISIYAMLYRRKNFSGTDVALSITNPIAYFLISGSIISDIYNKEGVGLLGLFLALLYGMSALIIRSLHSEATKETKLVRNIHIAISLPFIIVMLTTLIDNSIWTSVLIAFVGGIYVFLGTAIKSKGNRVMGNIAAIIGALAFLIENIGDRMDLFLINSRFVGGLIIVLVFVGIRYLYEKTELKNTKSEEPLMHLASLISFGMLFIILTIDTIEFYNESYVPLAWSLLTLAAVSYSYVLRDMWYRVMGYILQAVAVMYTIIDHWNLSGADYTPILNIRIGTTLLITLVLLLLIAMLYAHRDQHTDSRWNEFRVFLFYCVAALLFWALSREILDYYNSLRLGMSGNERFKLENAKRVALSFGWLLYAGVMLIVGVVRKLKPARLIALILLLVTVIKITLYDTANLSDFSRFISFIVLGVMLLVSGYIYYRFKDRIVQFVK